MKIPAGVKRIVFKQNTLVTKVKPGESPYNGDPSNMQIFSAGSVLKVFDNRFEYYLFQFSPVSDEAFGDVVAFEY